MANHFGLLRGSLSNENNSGNYGKFDGPIFGKPPVNVATEVAATIFEGMRRSYSFIHDVSP